MLLTEARHLLRLPPPQPTRLLPNFTSTPHLPAPLILRPRGAERDGGVGAGEVGEDGAVRAARGGEGGGDGGDGSPGVQHRRGALRGARADKEGVVRQERQPAQGLPPGRPAGVRHRRPVQRRQVLPHQHARPQEGGRPHSKKPGKTQLINHFLVNKSWYIVDLPGYGFANAPESARNDWASFTKGYFMNRDSLVAVLLLIDASIPPQWIDLDCANWLGRNNLLPFSPQSNNLVQIVWQDLDCGLIMTDKILIDSVSQCWPDDILI